VDDFNVLPRFPRLCEHEDEREGQHPWPRCSASSAHSGSLL